MYLKIISNLDVFKSSNGLTYLFTELLLRIKLYSGFICFLYSTRTVLFTSRLRYCTVLYVYTVHSRRYAYSTVRYPVFYILCIFCREAIEPLFSQLLPFWTHGQRQAPHHHPAEPPRSR